MKHLCLPLTAALLLGFTHTADAREPTVEEVRRVALSHAGLHGRTDKWSTRARLRHLLPEITADVGRIDQTDDNVQFDEWLSRDADEMLLYDAAKNQNENNRRMRNDFTIRATIDLGGLLFDDDELGASREARARLDARLEIIDVVHQTYFERLAALMELRTISTTDVSRRQTAALRVQMLEATLDALTGGWFAAELRRSP